MTFTCFRFSVILTSNISGLMWFYFRETNTKQNKCWVMLTTASAIP